MSPSRLSFLANTFSRFYPTRLSKPLLRPPLHLRPPRSVAFRPVRSFSAAVDSVFDAIPGLDSKLRDPWPEWVSFVGKLKEKGYFEEDASGAEDDGYGGSEVNHLKTACLRFARERFDIIRSLPKEEIEAVVGSGCPNLLRKVVNSSKRLRSYVKLDEGEVCASCNLRKSCDRAYTIIQADEVARTVDLVRILMSFAVEQAVDKYNGGEHVAPAARKLLSVLTELCDSAIDPSLERPAMMSMNKKEKAEAASHGENRFSNVEVKKGDWICSKCNFMNFARNIRCLKCKEDGPKRVDFSDLKMLEGDWTCPQCQFMNFSRNTKCRRCQESRPKGLLQSGEWLCPKCDFVNFRRNLSCLKCSCDRPEGDADQYEDNTWRRPKFSKEIREGRLRQ